MSEFDYNIERLIKGDNLDFKPDPSIKYRLLNYLDLKSVFSRVRRNSLFPNINLNSLFKLPAWKIGIVTVLFVFFIANNKINNNKSLLVNNDTVVNSQIIDTVNLWSASDSVR